MSPSPISPPALTEEGQAARTASRETLGRCDELERSLAFRWFIEEAVKPGLDAAQEVIDDLAKPLDQVQAARHVRKALLGLTTFLGERRRLAKAHLKP